jgi:hypothetical protein
MRRLLHDAAVVSCCAVALFAIGAAVINAFAI